MKTPELTHRPTATAVAERASKAMRRTVAKVKERAERAGVRVVAKEQFTHSS